MNLDVFCKKFDRPIQIPKAFTPLKSRRQERRMTLFILSFRMPLVPLIMIVCLLSRTIDAALRIFGGRDADPQEYPYVVKIEAKITANNTDAFFTRYSHLCTGSVLTPIWTLSSGHCMTLDKFTAIVKGAVPAANVKYVIRYGAITAKKQSIKHLSDITGSVLHPAFKLLTTRTGDAVISDVGLLRTTPIQLDRYARLSAVEYPSLAGQAAVTVGFGLAHDQEKLSSKLSKTLQLLDVVIKPCDKHISKGSLSAIVCLSRKCDQFPVSVCPGDSGGPLIHQSGVVGLNQMGDARDCTLQRARAGLSSGLVGIITPISPFLEWISDQIKYEV